MWQCPHCDEEQEDQFDSCWNCQIVRGDTPSVAPPTAVDASASTVTATRGKRNKSGNLAVAVMIRYNDAYLVAKATTTFGTIIKAIGFLLAFGMLSGALAVANQQSSDGKILFITVGVVAALITAAMFYLFGVLVSAQGQILKASLDGAVNSSPFLTDDQRAQTMSLR